MTTPNEIAPILAALCDGVPIGKVRPGEACPKLPAVAMVLLLDDHKGDGPSAFDSTVLFDQHGRVRRRGSGANRRPGAIGPNDY